MTLASFKKNSRLILVIVFLAAYALAFYFLGATPLKQNLAKLLNVKGVSTQKDIKSPLESPIPAADSQSASIIASYVKLCSNATYGFEVSYPGNWFTTYNTDDQKCTYFAPYSFTVPYATDIQFTPIYIEVVKPLDWVGTQNYYTTPNDFQNILSIQNMEIGGKAAQKVRAALSAKNPVTRGFSKVSFLILDSSSPLVLTYQQQDAKEDAAESEKVLEDITRSLKYF